MVLPSTLHDTKNAIVSFKVRHPVFSLLRRYVFGEGLDFSGTNGITGHPEPRTRRYWITELERCNVVKNTMEWRLFLAYSWLRVTDFVFAR